MYWILWYYNLLLAGLLARILFSLFRRKFLPYPTLAELRQHRQEVERAEDFSKTAVTRLVAARSVGIVEFFKILRDLRGISRRKAAEKLQSQSKVTISEGSTTGSIPEVVVETVEDHSTIAVHDISPEEADAVQSIMSVANNIADLHERIKKYVVWSVIVFH